MKRRPRYARLPGSARTPSGMSTVPETIVARQCGMNVAGLSCITNLAAGRGKDPLSHAEVLETGRRVQVTATNLMVNFARLYAQA
jgi:purine-nucleoside phosphorylase